MTTPRRSGFSPTRCLLSDQRSRRSGFSPTRRLLSGQKPDLRKDSPIKAIRAKDALASPGDCASHPAVARATRQPFEGDVPRQPDTWPLATIGIDSMQIIAGENDHRAWRHSRHRVSGQRRPLLRPPASHLRFAGPLLPAHASASLCRRCVHDIACRPQASIRSVASPLRGAPASGSRR